MATGSPQPQPQPSGPMPASKPDYVTKSPTILPPQRPAPSTGPVQSTNRREG
jgi:hypothetical protein